MIPATDTDKATSNAVNVAHEQSVKQMHVICDRNGGESDGNPFVNIMKNVFGFIIKPILDTKTKIIGNDKSKSAYEPQTLTAKMAGSYEYRRNQFGSMPDMFFDCDDFVEGSEDTVDFVADSTKIQWPSMSSSDSIYFECNALLDETTDSQKAAPLQPPHAIIDVNSIGTMAKAVCPMAELITAEPTVPEVHSHTSTADKPKTDANRDRTVQYIEGKPASLVETMDSGCLSRNNVKRKRRRNQFAKNGGKRAELCLKNSAVCKNRHEKNRHNVEMDILDDFSVYSMSSASEEEMDDDVGDDGDGDFVVAHDLIQLEPKKLRDGVAPKEIPSGCIFKYFYQLASPLRKLSTQIPAHLLARLTAVTSKAAQRKKSFTLAHLTDADSDDSFITFDDSCDDDSILKSVPRNAQRQRHSSECSDDFIVFCEDSIDGNSSYNEPFDDDYTDSSDDSDEEDEHDDDEEDTDDENDPGKSHANA